MEHYYSRIGEDWFTYPNFYSSVVKKFSSESKFVEIGCWKGRSACFLGVEILNSGKNITLDCVDTWEGSEEHIGYEVLRDDGLYREFIHNIDPIKHIINPIRMTSLEASKLYEDESLDFVFLDASHKYEDVKADMEAWYPKVKPGGIFSGHDYPTWPEVVKAVDEFFNPYGMNFSSSEYCWIHQK
jgi:SAM-dependent methyltransferase